MKKPLIILTGPTAVGKTELSIQLAKAINGEIISADSMQVYRHMDIGSAKVTETEMQGVVHHLIDVLEPTEAFDVVKFQKMAMSAIDKVYANGHIPIITGGTGFYIQALLYGIEFLDEDISESRIKWENFLKEHGNNALHEELKKVDPKSFELIHENNSKRVIRALEYFDIHNEPISKHNEEQKQKDSDFNFAYFVLNMNRDELYKRIDLRVDMMFDNGLIDEVKYLKSIGLTREDVSMQGIGYKEVLDYLDNKISLDEAKYIIKRDSRHYAKRQITWFKREKEVIWLSKDENPTTDLILKNILEICKEKNII